MGVQAGRPLSRVAFSPFPALSFTLIQSHSPPGAMAEVLAARGALILVAPPLGTALGGMLVDQFGPRACILVSASSTLALGVGIGIVLALRRRMGARRCGAPAGTGGVAASPIR